MIKNLFRAGVSAFAIIFSLTIFASAQTKPSKDFPNITIRNFGQMDERYYRGAQPKRHEYKGLAELGVNTVIDLRADPKDYEKPIVESLGMKYVNIPMGNGDYPKPEEIEAFMKLMNDPETGVVFVHCKGGKHRTGVTGAVYRFTKYGWDYDKAFREMKNYKFYSSWGYGDMKDFVQDYYQKILEERAKVDEAEKTAGADAAAQSVTSVNN